MRRVIYLMMVSLDGFTEGPNRELDWQIIDEELHTFVNDQQSDVDTYLYGRRMYEVMVEFWPTADTDPAAPEYIVEFARIWKNMPKIVFSKTLKTVEWNSRLVRDNVVEEVARLKERPGKDIAVAGPTLASTLIQHGLIDEYLLFVHPVIVGSGKRYFPALEDTINLRLIETHTFGSGVVYLRYQRRDERQ